MSQMYDSGAMVDGHGGPSTTLVNLWLRTRGFAENDFRSSAVVGVDYTTTTPMHRAAYENDSAICDYLCKYGGALRDVTSHLNTTRTSPLHLASGRGRLKVLAKMLDATKDPNSLWIRNGLGRTLLHEAALGGYSQVATFLCAAMKRASEKAFREVLCHRDATGFTPIMAAASDCSASH